MRKASGKRLQHGVTSALVLTELLRQYSQTGVPTPVPRAALVQALELLPATTVVDRLRVLVKQGRVRLVKRGMYAPAMPTDNQAQPASKPTQPAPQKRTAPEEMPVPSKAVTIYPNGMVKMEVTLTESEYLEYEGRRQRRAYGGKIPW